MRMTRNRRRSQLAHRHRGQWMYRKTARIPVSLLLAGTAAGLPLEANAALSVLQDISSDFDYMQNNFANIRGLDQSRGYVAEAEEALVMAQVFVEEAKQSCLDAEENLKDAETNLRQAEADVRQTEQDLQAARERRAELTRQAVAAQQAVADYLPVWYEAQGDLQHKLDVQEAAAVNHPASAGSSGASWSAAQEQRAEWIQAAWEEADFETNRLPEIEARFDGGSEADAAGNSEADAYDAYLAEVDSAAEAAQENFDNVSEWLDELKSQQQEAEEAEADCRQEVIELQIELAQNQQAQLECEADVEICRADRTEAYDYQVQAIADCEAAVNDVYLSQFALAHFDDGMSAQKTVEYYSWQGSQRQSGHQLYSGNSFSLSKNHYEFSISNAYVISHTGQVDGDMSGLTDTTVSAMYTNKHPVYDVKYGLEVNLPTGDSRSYNNAVAPDYLARASRLGEGWNFTPRLEVTRHLDKYTSLTGRTALAFRGSYDDSRDDLTSAMHPGNQWSNEIEYLHTAEHEQYMAKLQYTHNSSAALTGANGYGFTEGDGITGRCYYRRWFAPQDSWGAYMAYSFDRAAAYDTDAMSGAGVHRLYYGTGWFHQFDQKNQMRLFANWMRAEGDTYDPLTRQTYASGRRFSVSLGYDWRMDDKNSLSLDLERAVLRQQGDANYRSWGIALSYNRSF